MVNSTLLWATHDVCFVLYYRKIMERRVHKLDSEFQKLHTVVLCLNRLLLQ